MIEVIFAMTETGGIGNRGILPWSPKIEAFIFKAKTTGCNLIVGRRTYATLPPLPGRKLFVVSRSSEESYPRATVLPGIREAIEACRKDSSRIFIIGGAEIYREVFTNYRHLVTRVHRSVMTGSSTIECDTFIYYPHASYRCVSRQDFGAFVHYVEEPISLGEIQYTSLLDEVWSSGYESMGRNGLTKSVFGKNLKFDLRDGFPLITTKKMFFRGIVEEFLFFLRGDTDSKILEARGVNIWKGNTSSQFLDSVGLPYREGEMGPMYGYQWRHFGAPYGGTQRGIDQLSAVVEKIKTDPKSRRILMTTFNPAQVDEGVLYPCHSIVTQFFVEDGFLDMFCYNRSSDLFLGLPFNIASSGLLLALVAKWTNLQPRFLNLSLGDCHIYSQHMDAVLTQLSRTPHRFPVLDIECGDGISTIPDLSASNFHIIAYESYPSIKAEMIA